MTNRLRAVHHSCFVSPGWIALNCGIRCVPVRSSGCRFVESFIGISPHLGDLASQIVGDVQPVSVQDLGGCGLVPAGQDHEHASVAVSYVFELLASEGGLGQGQVGHELGLQCLPLCALGLGCDLLRELGLLSGRDLSSVLLHDRGAKQAGPDHRHHVLVVLRARDLGGEGRGGDDEVSLPLDCHLVVGRGDTEFLGLGLRVFVVLLPVGGPLVNGDEQLLHGAVLGQRIDQLLMSLGCVLHVAGLARCVVQGVEELDLGLRTHCSSGLERTTHDPAHRSAASEVLEHVGCDFLHGQVGLVGDPLGEVFTQTLDGLLGPLLRGLDGSRLQADHDLAGHGPAGLLHRKPG